MKGDEIVVDWPGQATLPPPSSLPNKPVGGSKLGLHSGWGGEGVYVVKCGVRCPPFGVGVGSVLGRLGGGVGAGALRGGRRPGRG